jgi:hypothetical protein
MIQHLKTPKSHQELFALVAFGFDIRQKFPEASRQLDFSTNLRRCVRERDRKRLEELGALMHHMMKGLAKRKTPIDGLLYRNLEELKENLERNMTRIASHVDRVVECCVYWGVFNLESER